MLSLLPADSRPLRVGGWSMSGLDRDDVASSSSDVTCFSSHLTSFAILVDASGVTGVRRGATPLFGIPLHCTFQFFYQNLLQNGLLRMKYILRILVYIICLHFYVCSICVALSLFLSKFAQKWTLMKYILRILVYIPVTIRMYVHHGCAKCILRT